MDPSAETRPDPERGQPEASGDARRRRKLADGLLFLATVNLLAIALAGGLALPFGSHRIISPPLVWSALIWGVAAAWRAGAFDAPNRGRLAQALSSRRQRVALILLTAVGLALRIASIDFGFPLLVQPDEPSVAGVAVEMLRSGWIDPQWYIYPTFFMNLLLPAFAIYYVYGRGRGFLAPLDQVRSTTPGFYLIGRYYSAVLGTLTIPLTCWLAERLLGGERGRRAGLIAAALVTFSFIHVRESHFAVTDVPAGAVATAALLAIAGVLHAGSWRDYLAAGLLCGLAASTKYTAAPIVLSLAAAHLAGRGRGERLDGRPAIALAAVPAGFLLGSPYALLDWKPFLEHLGWLGTYAGSPSLEQLRANFWQVVGYAHESGMGAPAFWVLLAAIVAALWRWRGPELVLVAFILGSVPQMTHSTHRFFPRFLVPLVPAAAVLIGGLLVDAAQWLQERAWLRRRAALQREALRGLLAPALLAAAGIILVLPNATQSVRWVNTAAALDTRAAAYLWIRERFPDGAVIATEEPLVGMPAGFRALDWAPPLQQYTPDDLTANAVDVVIFSSLWDPRPASAAATARQRLKDGLGEAQRFAGLPQERRPGPTLELFRVPR